MLFPTLMTGGLSLLLLSAGDLAAEKMPPRDRPEAVLAVSAQDLSPGPRLRDADAFPSAEMAEQFRAYLTWTKQQGLSRLAVFETLDPRQSHLSPNLSVQQALPTPEMQAQFEAYLSWTRREGLSPFYAFSMADFD
jgi:hypothetical protein